ILTGICIGLALHSTMAAALPLFACCVFVATIRWPLFVVFGLVTFDATVEQLLKIYHPGSATVPAVSDALAVVALCALAVKYGLPKPRTFLDVVIMAFVSLVALMALLNPLAPHGLQLAGGVRTLALYPVFYFYGGRLLHPVSAVRW